MKRHATNAILLFLLLVGLSLLLYPSVSNYWNSFHQARAIATYSDQVEALDDGAQEDMRSEATAYNTALINDPGRFSVDDAKHSDYEQLLNPGGNGIMGYIEIPSIDVSLSIYHGTDADVLQVGVGHMEGSSLPVGGQGTHAVLSGHRGLPSALLFTNLDKVQVGDVFYIHVLGERLTYQIDDIRIVLPNEINNLAIVPDEDYCTLVTCTPYGINTHRLLVRGTRIENEQAEAIARVAADAFEIDSLMLVPILAIPVLLIGLIVVLLFPKKRSSTVSDDMLKKRRKGP